MPAKRHLHMYRKVKSREGYYKCIHPDCTHVVQREFLDGKRARCYYCQEPYVVTWRALQLITLRCEDCRYKAPKIKKVQKTIQDLINVN